MQATLDIDDDILRAIETRSRVENKTPGETLSELARVALVSRSSEEPLKTSDAAGCSSFTPFPKRGGRVTDELINKIRKDDCY